MKKFKSSRRSSSRISRMKILESLKFSESKFGCWNLTSAVGYRFACGIRRYDWYRMNFMTCLFAEYRGSNTVFYDNQWFKMIKIKNYNALCNCSKESICLKVLFSLRVKFFNSKICASLRFDSSIPSTATIRWAELFFTLDS